MSNIKFTQLPNLGNITAATIIPVVDSGVNYSVTTANLQSYVNGGAGNITTGNLSATGNITGSYILGNGSQLTGLPQSYTNANVVSLLSAFGSNTISTTGNVTVGYVIGNGSQLTGVVSSYGNANVAAYLPTYTGNLAGGNLAVTTAITTGTASATGTVTADNFVAVGTTRSSFPSANLTSGFSSTTYQNGALIVSGGIGVSGSINVRGGANIGDGTTPANLRVANGSLLVTGAVSATGNVTGGNVLTGGLISATGNVSGAYFIGNGSALTGIATTGNYVDLTTNQTVAGNKSFTGTTTLGPYIETTAASVNISGSFTPTMSNGPVQRVTATGNFTLNLPSGMTTGQSITLVITQDATGSRVMTANATYKFAYGIESLSTAANAIDMLSIFYDGANYLCNLVKGYS
jgi:hypothetical protein